jgi:hypothetical protein
MLLSAALCCAQKKDATAPVIDEGMPIVYAANPVTHPCTGSEWSLLDSAEVKALLADYDFAELHPLDCLSADAPWLKTGEILRFKGINSRRTDDVAAFTLLRAKPGARIWFVPIEHGMVGFPLREDDAHNLAAFNELLRMARYLPNENQLMDLSNLYQFVVGMEQFSDPNQAPKTIREATSISDVEWETSRNKPYVDLTHRERFGDSWTHLYMVWEFRYRVTEDSFRLLDVSRKSLADYSIEK